MLFLIQTLLSNEQCKSTVCSNGKFTTKMRRFTVDVDFCYIVYYSGGSYSNFQHFFMTNSETVAVPIPLPCWLITLACPLRENVWKDSFEVKHFLPNILIS